SRPSRWDRRYSAWETVQAGKAPRPAILPPKEGPPTTRMGCRSLSWLTPSLLEAHVLRGADRRLLRDLQDAAGPGRPARPGRAPGPRAGGPVRGRGARLDRPAAAVALRRPRGRPRFPGQNGS